MALLRRSLAVAAVLAAVALPVPAALAQTPGDQQYQDPFGGSAPSGSSGGGSHHPGGNHSSSGTSTPTSSSTPAPSSTNTSTTTSTTTTTAASAATPDPTATASTASTPQQLPFTGVNDVLVGLAGVLLLGSGIALRARLREDDA